MTNQVNLHELHSKNLSTDASVLLHLQRVLRARDSVPEAISTLKNYNSVSILLHTATEANIYSIFKGSCRVRTPDCPCNENMQVKFEVPIFSHAGVISV